MSKPILWIVIPCYNEEQVLPITAPMFLQKIHDLTAAGLVSNQSRVLFVNDGSRDKTWELITGFAKEDEHFIGISQSRNRGHQNAVLADIVFNHADYRLISTRVLESFADYREVNIFLRGMVPLVGFPSEVVTYERHERLAGDSHYPLSKMLALAFDGITSLSNKPIRLITGAV